MGRLGLRVLHTGIPWSVVVARYAERSRGGGAGGGGLKRDSSRVGGGARASKEGNPRGDN